MKLSWKMKSMIYIEISIQRSIFKNEIMTVIWVKIKMSPPVTKADERQQKEIMKIYQMKRRLRLFFQSGGKFLKLACKFLIHVTSHNAYVTVKFLVLLSYLVIGK